MSRDIRCRVTDDFGDAVSQYRAQEQLSSDAQALLRLATIGYIAATGQQPPVALTSTWGGAGRNQDKQKKTQERNHEPQKT